MKTSILAVTYRRDFRYLVFALRSALKYAKGFDKLVVSCPRTDQNELEQMVRDVRGFWPSTMPIVTRYFDEWPGKGMLHHMFIIMNADCITESDFIVHLDSDHVFTDIVHPEDYIKGGKPDLVCAEFDWLIGHEHFDGKEKGKVEPGVRNWQNASFRALGVTDSLEFMRRAPMVHCACVYAQARKDIEAHTGEKLESFMQDQRNRYPQTFAEFQTLGSVAYRKFNDRYNWLRQEKDQWTSGFIRQAWSHRPPTAEDIEFYKKLGLGA